MEPVATALDILQGDKHVYMGYLLPTLTVVKMAIENLPPMQFCEPLREVLIGGFNKRYRLYFYFTLYCNF